MHSPERAMTFFDRLKNLITWWHIQAEARADRARERFFEQLEAENERDGHARLAAYAPWNDGRQQLMTTSRAGLSALSAAMLYSRWSGDGDFRHALLDLIHDLNDAMDIDEFELAWIHEDSDSGSDAPPDTTNAQRQRQHDILASVSEHLSLIRQVLSDPARHQASQVTAIPEVAAKHLAGDRTANLPETGESKPDTPKPHTVPDDQPDVPFTYQGKRHRCGLNRGAPIVQHAGVPWLVTSSVPDERETPVPDLATPLLEAAGDWLTSRRADARERRYTDADLSMGGAVLLVLSRDRRNGDLSVCMAGEIPGTLCPCQTVGAFGEMAGLWLGPGRNHNADDANPMIYWDNIEAAVVFQPCMLKGACYPQLHRFIGDDSFSPHPYLHDA